MQYLNLEQGLEWKLPLFRPAFLPDCLGAIPSKGCTGSKAALFFFAGYGIGVPVNGVSNPTTVYNLNGDLKAFYKVPDLVPGTTTPFTYIALAQESNIQLFQSYYAGFRLKTFNYNVKQCKGNSREPVQMTYPSIFALWYETNSRESMR